MKRSTIERWIGFGWISLLVVFGPAALASEVVVIPSLGSMVERDAVMAPLSIEEVIREPRIQQVTLAPKGDRLAYRLGGDREHPDRLQEVWIFDPKTGQHLLRTASRSVTGMAWATDGSGLFLETSGRIAFLPVSEGRPTFVYRLDPGLERTYRGVDPVRPHHILVTEKQARNDFRLLSIGLGGTSESLLAAESPIFRYLLDNEGRVAFVTLARDDQLAIDRVLPSGRTEVLRCSFLDPCQPVALSAEGSGLLLRTRGAADLEGLYRLDLDLNLDLDLDLDSHDARLDLLHQDPLGRADLAAVSLDPVDRSPTTVGYKGDRFRQYLVDDHHRVGEESLAEDFDRLQALLEKTSGILDIRRRGPLWLVEEAGPEVQHPRYWLFDRREGELRPLLEAERLRGNPLPENRLSATHFVSYRASDGLDIPGFVTIPRGVDPAVAPLVALVHGGPWNQVSPTFSGPRQALASRGYIVYEPNFRASIGYGLHHVLAARGEFGDGRVLRDIVEGVEALLGLGLGDRDRVGIVGHSFGGFSVLSALAFSPEHFAVGVASAPPIDLLRSLDQIDPSFTLPHGLKQREVVERLLVDGERAASLERLQRRSPEFHLNETARPLVILAGGEDAKVDIVDVKHYATELQSLGKDVTLFVDPDSGHSFVEPRLRRAWLFLTETVLAEYLGGAVGSLPDDRLESYLRRNSLIVGETLRPTLSPSDDSLDSDP